MAAFQRRRKKIAYVIPILIILVLLSGLKNGVPCYKVFLEGAEEGMRTVLSVFPPLVAILAASAMLKESGAVSALCGILSPITDFFKIPSELMPLALIRPLSGGGSLALLTDMLSTYGADSRIALAACILCASTETTFYTISVYFGGTSVKYTKRVILAAVLGDLAGILCASALSAIIF